MVRSCSKVHQYHALLTSHMSILWKNYLLDDFDVTLCLTIICKYLQTTADNSIGLES